MGEKRLKSAIRNTSMDRGGDSPGCVSVFPGRGRPCQGSVSVVLAAPPAAGAGWDVAHQAGEFQSDPLPRKPQIWFWADIKQKKCGEMSSLPDSLIYSDSLRWGHGAN